MVDIVYKFGVSMIYIVIAIIGIVAGMISGIVGTGSSIILLPILSFAFGPKAAIPIMAIASVMGNISRVIMWRKDVQIKAFLLYSIPAIPFAVLGANTLWVIPANLSNICIGLFFLLLIPIRHWAKNKQLKLSGLQLIFAGGIVGYLTGIVFSTGPLTVPIFAGFGLTKGALLSTEAASSFVVYLAKAFTFGTIGAIPWSVLFNGVVIGSTMIVGLYIGKKFVLQMSDRIFNGLIDGMMLIAGFSMLWDAVGVN